MGIDLSEMRSWPPGGASAPSAPSAPASIEYPDTSIAGLAGRCAEAASGWGEPEKTAAATPASLWKDPDAHPLVLLLMAMDRYKDGALEWEPEVLRVTMNRDGLQVSGASWSKLMGARLLVMSPSPWRQWEVFHWVARALAGHPPNITYLELPEIGHLMVAADLMKIVDPKRLTTTEVDKFAAAALKHEGQVLAPAPLDFAARELEDPQLECKKCGALHRDDNDIRCVSCGSTELKRVPYVFADLRDQCAKLWNARRDRSLEQAVEGLPEDAAGNLVYHLLVHWDYARSVRQQLLRQLRALTL